MGQTNEDTTGISSFSSVQGEFSQGALITALIARQGQGNTQGCT